MTRHKLDAAKTKWLLLTGAFMTVFFGPSLLYILLNGAGPAKETPFTVLAMYLFSAGIFFSAAATIAFLCFFFAFKE